MTIDWQDITIGYNRQTASQLTTAEMLEHLYRSTGSVRKMSNYLGISDDAIARKMDLLNVQRFRKGPWSNSKMFNFMSIPDEQLAKLTSKQIAAKLQCTVPTVYSMAMKSRRNNYLHSKRGIKANEKDV